MKRTTLCILLVVLPAIIMAQVLSPYYNSWRRSNAEYNDFKSDNSNAEFTSVTKSVYDISDTNLHVKKLVSELKAKFDANGENILEVRSDSNRHITDSVIHVYDLKDNLLKESIYLLDDSTGQMHKFREQLTEYNSHNKVVKDSEYTEPYLNKWELKKMKNRKDRMFRKVVTYYTYQNDTNEIKNTRISVSGTLLTGEKKDTYDTLTYITKYDSKGREIYVEEFGGWAPFRRYDRYDDRGRNIFSATVGNDSTYSYMEFDSRGKRIRERRYTNGSLEYVDSTGKNAEGLRTETQEEITSARAHACTNSKLTVSVYDRSDRVISKTVTRLENGLNEVTTTIDKYLVDSTDKVLIDSAFNTTEGFLHSVTSEQVYQYKYDAKGNEIWRSVIGGGSYSNNYSEIWKYNEQNSKIYNARYNSCVPDKPESETMYIYYDDGKSLKEKKDVSGLETGVTYYDKEGKIVKEVFPPDADNNNRITEIDYIYTR